MEEAIVIILIVFVSIVLLFGTPFYFRHRNRRVIYDAIKTSVEKTGEADPKLIAAITHDTVGPNVDLRRGILLIAIAIAMAGFGFIAGGDLFGFPAMALALFPGLVGGAYIVLHYLFPREPTV